MAQEVIRDEQSILALLKSKLIERIGSERFDLWITEDTQWNFCDETLTIDFTSDFSCQLCRKTLGAEIQLVLEEVTGGVTSEIQYRVVAPTKTVNGSAQKQISASDPYHPTTQNHPNTQSRSATRVQNPLGNKTCPTEVSPGAPASSLATASSEGAAVNGFALHECWSSIVQGESNQMAIAAVKMALAEPGRITPIVIHGATGTGKSLLLSSLAQNLRNHRRLRRVVHMTSEQFTNDFTEGLRGGGLPVFRRKYRDVEALLLDDVQFFLGKKSTIAEARHTIDNLLRCGKQVVVSTDRSLHELEGLGGELLGRLRGGLVVPVFPLTCQMRQQLLQRWIDSAGVKLDGAIIKQLAERIGGDGRLVRGAVHRLVAAAATTAGQLTWEQSWTAVFDLIQAHRPVVRLVDIERTVCSMFGLEQDSLQSHSKTRSVSQPRMLAMFLARKYTSAAYKEIGDYFGRRRHSTVISAEKTVESWLRDNAKLDGMRSLAVRDAIRHVEAQLQVG